MGLRASVEAFRRYRLSASTSSSSTTSPARGWPPPFSASSGLPAASRAWSSPLTPFRADLGRGRFERQDFAREIGEIAAGLRGRDGSTARTTATARWTRPPTTVRSSLGQSLRSRFLEYAPRGGAKVLVSHEELLAYLSTLHPVHYGQLAGSIDALFVEDLGPIRDQDAALRFVHLVDKLYDRRVRLFVSSVRAR